MDLSDIISISGKPGLYEIVAQTKNGIIVASIQDGKRIPAYAKHRISKLDDISIYTVDDEVSLREVYQNIWDKEKGGPAIHPKTSSSTDLRNYMSEILPNFDEKRVYTSDIKKLLTWYNQLHVVGRLKWSETATPEEEESAVADAEILEATTDEANEPIASEEEKTDNKHT